MVPNWVQTLRHMLLSLWSELLLYLAWWTAIFWHNKTDFPSTSFFCEIFCHSNTNSNSPLLGWQSSEESGKAVTWSMESVPSPWFREKNLSKWFLLLTHCEHCRREESVPDTKLCFQGNLRYNPREPVHMWDTKRTKEKLNKWLNPELSMIGYWLRITSKPAIISDPVIAGFWNWLPPFLISSYSFSFSAPTSFLLCESGDLNMFYSMDSAPKMTHKN